METTTPRAKKMSQHRGIRSLRTMNASMATLANPTIVKNPAISPAVSKEAQPDHQKARKTTATNVNQKAHTIV
jgi:hypothetical protein